MSKLNAIALTVGLLTRPTYSIETRCRKMSRENPLWGVPRVQAELRLLGFDLADETVAKYRVRGSASPPQIWKAFLANHAKQIAAIDFGAVPTLTFRNLYCFIILLHDSRHVIPFNVTEHPTAECTARQLIESFPEDRGAALSAQGSRSNLRGRISIASKGDAD